MRGYIIGFVCGLVLAASGVAAAAIGDLIYEANDSVTITGPQAANIADAFIAVSAWTGARGNMRTCTVARLNGSFSASCSGTKEAAAAALPINGGVQVVGRVE